MTPSDKGQPHDIPDLGAKFEDLLIDGEAIHVWSAEKFRKVLDHLTWVEVHLNDIPPAPGFTWEEWDDHFRDVKKILRNTVRREHNFSEHK